MNHAAGLLPDLEALHPHELKALIVEQHKQILIHHEQLLSRDAEIEHLQLLLAKLRRMQFGRSSEKVDRQIAQEKVNDANIQLMRQDIRSQRKKVVAANMPLTEEEATKFWPVYDRYIAETIKVNDLRFDLIKEYAKNYETGTEEQADSFIKRWLALDQDNTQLRLKYIPEFEKVISRKKTAMFFQIDRRVSMMIELQLASNIPLVKP